MAVQSARGVFPRRLALAAAASFALAGAASGQLFQRPPTIIDNARILTMDGDVIERGSIIIRGGRIERVGTDLAAPANALRIDAAGQTVSPGFIDVWGTLGLVGGGNAGDPTLRAFDAFNPYDHESFEEAWRQGVVAVYLPAIGGAGVNGTGAVARLSRDPRLNTVGRAVREEVAVHMDLGSEQSPVRRLANLNALRARLRAAIDYRSARELYFEEELVEYEKKIKERAEKEQASPPAAQDPPRPPQPAPGQRAQGQQQANAGEIRKPSEPATNRQHDVLIRVLDRELPVRLIANRAEDILNALDLQKEFGFEMVIEGGAEAHLVADRLAEAKVTVVLGEAVSSPYRGTPAANAAALERAGVKWVIGSGGRSSFVLHNAQIAASEVAGVEALELVTRRAAAMLGLNDHGVIAPGRAADLVIWSDDPREASARVERVIIDGQVVFDRATEEGGSNR